MDLSGRCYCGNVTLNMTVPPEKIAICHCADCRRVTGAPMAAFAAFPEQALTMTPDQGGGVSTTPGVKRWFCARFGSPLAAVFDYLPDQIYVPVGVLDFADVLTPDVHCHSAEMLHWLDALASLPRHHGSAREDLCRTNASS